MHLAIRIGSPVRHKRMHIERPEPMVNLTEPLAVHLPTVDGPDGHERPTAGKNDHHALIDLVSFHRCASYVHRVHCGVFSCDLHRAFVTQRHGSPNLASQAEPAMCAVQQLELRWLCRLRLDQRFAGQRGGTEFSKQIPVLVCTRQAACALDLIT